MITSTYLLELHHPSLVGPIHRLFNIFSVNSPAGRIFVPINATLRERIDHVDVLNQLFVRRVYRLWV